MTHPPHFVYAFHLNAARLQEEQGILPRELTDCVKKIGRVFNREIHGQHGHFICPSPKGRRLLISFECSAERVIITAVVVVRWAVQLPRPVPPQSRGYHSFNEAA